MAVKKASRKKRPATRKVGSRATIRVVSASHRIDEPAEAAAVPEARVEGAGLVADRHQQQRGRPARRPTPGRWRGPSTRGRRSRPWRDRRRAGEDRPEPLEGGVDPADPSHRRAFEAAGEVEAPGEHEDRARGGRRPAPAGRPATTPRGSSAGPSATPSARAGRPPARRSPTASPPNPKARAARLAGVITLQTPAARQAWSLGSVTEDEPCRGQGRGDGGRRQGERATPPSRRARPAARRDVAARARSRAPATRQHARAGITSIPASAMRRRPRVPVRPRRVRPASSHC